MLTWATVSGSTRGGAARERSTWQRRRKGPLAWACVPGAALPRTRVPRSGGLGDFTRFIREVAPVPEEAGVMIGVHPDDPPVPMLGGIPRIFSSFEGYRRALEIADSPNVGICFCVG